MITDLSQLDLDGHYSYADYLKWKFEETVELLKGKIALMSPAPRRLHQQVSGQLHGLFWQFFRNHPCHYYAAPFDVRLTRNLKESENQIFTVVQPDICVVCDLEKLDDYGCLGAPDLIVEIVSKSSRQKDFHDKFELYEEAGVHEYWIVEPLEKTIYQNFLQEGKYKNVGIFGEGEVLSSRHFPGLDIEIDMIFKD